jgi:MinD-like ATPase involved in chromosome partitioning or flagellar assembly
MAVRASGEGAATTPRSGSTRMGLGPTTLRALDPRLTSRIRTERAQYDAVSAPLRRGSSIAVVGGASGSGRSTVAALVAVALAEYQGAGVVAVDAGDSGALYRRLAVRGGGSVDAVLGELGIRGGRAGRPAQLVVRRRWLRQHLALGDNLLLVATDPAVGTPRLGRREYGPMVRALRRHVSAMVADTPPLANDSVVPSVVTNADHVVVVGPDNSDGPAWISAALPWLAAVRGRVAGESVTGVLVARGRSGGQRPMAPTRPAASGVPVFALPYDAALADGAPVRWTDLAAPTQRAVLLLVGDVMRGLA